MKRILRTLLLITLISAMSISVFAFTDVTPDTPYQAAIDYLSTQGIIDGYPDGTFRPDDVITRAEFCKMIMTSLGQFDATAGSADIAPFTDIDYHWAKDYITAAAQSGYVNGVGDDQFAPDKYITCEQAIAIVVRIISGPKTSYPADYLAYALKEEISSGVPVITGRNITRGEVAQIIFNISEKTRFVEEEAAIIASLTDDDAEDLSPPLGLVAGNTAGPPTALPSGAVAESVLEESPPLAVVSGYDSGYQSSMYNYQDYYNTEEYLSNSENIFTSPVTSPLSTFSLDVNTASYSLIRRQLQNGRVPDSGSVKIEEMVNYFEYELAQPSDGTPFAVTTEVHECPWNSENYLAMIALQGYDIDKEDMPPSNLVFLIDISGSMFPPDRLPLAQRAMSLLVDELRPQDTVSIVVYASSTGVVLEATPGSEKETIKNAIYRLRAGGSTYGAGGILLAYEEAQKNYIEGGNNRVILCTDGDFNVGVSSTSALEDLITEQRESGIFLSILGFGMGNVKDNKMETLAIRGNGNYAYIDNLKEAKKVLIDDMTSTIFTIAKDVKLQVEFNPETVAAYRLIGYEKRILNAEDFSDDQKDAGEMGAGHSMIAFYEIIPQGSENWDPDELKYQTMETTGSDELMTIELRYKEPDSETSILMEPVVVEGLTDAPASETYNFSSCVAEWGLIMGNSSFKADADIESIINRAFENMGSDTFGYRAEFIQLVNLSKLILPPE